LPRSAKDGFGEKVGKIRGRNRRKNLAKTRGLDYGRRVPKRAAEKSQAANYSVCQKRFPKGDDNPSRKIMKTCTIFPLNSGTAPLPRHGTIGWLRLRIFVTLALLALAIVPRLRADDLSNLSSFEFSVLEHLQPYFTVGSSTSNIGSNPGGAEAVAKLCVASGGGVPHFRGVSPKSSSTSDVLFGTASSGGNSGQGTVFAINTDGTGFTVLHNFTGGADGGFPTAGLILSGNMLYGTTVNGGNSDQGTVFALTTNSTGNTLTVLHHFTARNQFPYTNSDGGNPYAALTLSGNTLYGTTSGGGTGNGGTVFALNISNTNFTVLHHFTTATFDPNFILTNSDGANPFAGLVLSSGTLFGTASRGGPAGSGTVFGVNTNGTNFTVLHDFSAVDPLYQTNSDGISPLAGLVLSDGTLYGTAMQGGNANSGTVFSVNTNGANFTNLYNFTGGSDGFKPVGELVLSTDTLFGTTRAGGNATTGNGTVFALKTDGKGFTVVHTFTAGNYDTNLPPIGFNLTNSDGAVPQAGLVLSGNALYGTTSAGGDGGNGTVFSLSASQLTILGVTLSGTNLVINGANGQSGGTYVAKMSTNLSLSLNQWTPVATNVLNTSGNFTLTVTNAVDIKAPRRFYILQGQ
jgi:uncharacterized repeat protein (TIGR03803 family)